MADRDIALVLRYLRRSLGGDGDMSDGQLVEQLSTANRPAAFKALVRRHERLVSGVCRRHLRDLHDAEDAFQATFLALLRKGSAISHSEAVASWLYKVAFRIAIDLRAKRAKFNAHEQPLTAAEAAVAPVHFTMPLEMQELRALLDEELNRLPERFRAPLILCYLEGRSLDEAALHLGCPRGTVASRLARGRERLRARLTRRGLAISGAGLAAGLTQTGWSIAAPLSLVGTTVQLAKLCPAGSGAAAVVSAQVLSLTAEVLRAMFIKKIVVAVAVLAISTSVLLMGGGVGLRIYSSAAAEPGERAADASPPLPQQEPPAQQKKPPAKEQSEFPKVTVSKPVQKEVALSAEFPGRLQSSKAFNVSATVSGRLASIHCQEGAAVKSGDLLFKLDDTVLREALQRTRAGYEIASTRQEGSSKLAARLEAMVANKVTSAEELEKARSAAAIASAELRLAMLDVERAERELQATQIKAPADGKIGAIRLEVGSGVTADKTVLTTVSLLDPIQVAFQLDQQTYERYQQALRDRQMPDSGSLLFIGLQDEKGFPHKGSLVSFADSFDPLRGTISVRASMPNPDGRLIPGMYARVLVAVGKPQKTLLIPASSNPQPVFSTKPDQIDVPEDVVPREVFRIFVLGKNDVVEARTVKLGQHYQGMIIIAEGLRPDDWVVIEGADKLRPGDRVEPNRK